MADNSKDQKDYQDYLEYQHYLQASKQAANPPVSMDGADKAARPSQQYMSPGESATNNVWTNLKAKITDPQRYRAILTGGGPAATETVGSDLGAATLALPLEAAPESIAKLASYLMGKGIGPALARVGANAATGGVAGAWDNEKDPLNGAIRGAAFGGALGTGGELAGQLTRPFSAVSSKLGEWLGGLSKEEAAAYKRDPALAEELYSTEKTNPLAFDEMAKEQTQKAASNLQENYIDPRKSDISLQGVGKTYQVNPEQFKGTAAEPEIAQSWAKQGQTQAIPVSEPYKVEATPVQEKLTYGQPQEQTFYNAEDPYKAKTAQVSTVSRGFEKAGDPQVLEQGLFDRGTQEVPASIPNQMSLGTEPMLRAKRAAGSAANLNYSYNPSGVGPAEQAAAKANSKAAVDLGSALKEQTPEIAQLDSEISDAISRKQQLEGLGNPNRIYQAGDLPSNVPIRSLRQYLDQNTGSNFQDTANSLFAGRALNGPMDTIKGKYTQALPAKAALRAAGGLEALKEILKTSTPATQRAVMGLFEAGNK